MQKKLIKFVTVPKISDDCLLCFAQKDDHIPFIIKRIYHISGAKPKKPRGFHAHYKTRQVLFCIQGSIRLILDNGKIKQGVVLDKPEVGLLIDKMVWHEMHNFKKDTILLCLASSKFDEKDYIRDYETFLKKTKV